MTAGSRTETAAERFWQKVDKTETCWLWTGCKDRNGYGLFCVERHRNLAAHRWSYSAVHGFIPSTVHVLHTCDTPACVRPDHLWPGTPAENMADKKAKGRAHRLPGELNPNARLTWAQVDEMRSAFSGERGQIVEIARVHGVHKSVVGRIVRGKAWVR